MAPFSVPRSARVHAKGQSVGALHEQRLSSNGSVTLTVVCKWQTLKARVALHFGVFCFDTCAIPSRPIRSRLHITLNISCSFRDSGLCSKTMFPIVAFLGFAFRDAKAEAGEGVALEAVAEETETEAETMSAGEVLRLTNAERSKTGAPALSGNSRLNTAAKRHSDDMSRMGRLTHTGSDGSSVGQRATRQGYSWSAIAENVARGYSSASAVVRGWMNSDGHRRNILNSRYRHMGFGKTGYVLSKHSF